MVDRRRKWRAQNQNIRVKKPLGGDRYVVTGTRGKDYVVNLGAPSCTCPDWKKRAPKGGCKHVLHVEIENGRRKPLPDARTSFGSKTDDSSGGYSPEWNTLSLRTRKRDDWRCQKCGAKGGPRGAARVEAHHIVPKSKGGKDELDNLITLCHSCHETQHGHSIPRGSSPDSRPAASRRRGNANTTSSESSTPPDKARGTPAEPDDATEPSSSKSKPKSKSGSSDSRTRPSSRGAASHRDSPSEGEPPLLPPSPKRVESDGYEIRVSKRGSLSVTVVWALVLGAILFVFLGPQAIWVTLLLAVIVFAVSSLVAGEDRNRMTEITQCSEELRSALGAAHEKRETGETVTEAELERLRGLLRKLDYLITARDERNVSDDYLEWLAMSNERMGVESRRGR